MDLQPKIPAENHAGRKKATQVEGNTRRDESGDKQVAIAVHVRHTEVPHGGKCHSVKDGSSQKKTQIPRPPLPCQFLQ